jgi:hypothetical protein
MDKVRRRTKANIFIDSVTPVKAVATAKAEKDASAKKGNR